MHNLAFGSFNWLDDTLEDNLKIAGHKNDPHTTIYSLTCFLLIYIISKLIEHLEFSTIPQKASAIRTPSHDLLLQKCWAQRQIKILSDGLVQSKKEMEEAAKFEKERLEQEEIEERERAKKVVRTKVKYD